MVWRAVGTVYRRRRLVILVTGIAAVLSVVISLLIPNSYRAASRLLLPESSGGNVASALLGDLGSAAQSLLGGGASDYVRYIAILGSRTVLESVVDTFDLVTVYDLEDNSFPTEDAISLLVDNVEFLVDDEYQFFSIAVVDRDPERAADMANYFVRALDEVNNELSMQTAGNFRRYVELRYDESVRARDALLDSLQVLQSRYGVYDLTAQTEAYFSQLGEMRVAAIAAEIQYEALRDQYGSTNQRVELLERTVTASRRKFQDALAGREQILPVSTDQVPAVVRAYLDIEMERAIQERILEFVAPMLEQARFEERRQSSTVQVVDPAMAPVRKVSPKRSVICVVVTLSAFLLVILYVLLIDWWQQNHAYFAGRLREAVDGKDRA